MAYTITTTSGARGALFALATLALGMTACGEKGDLDAVACERGALDCPCQRDSTCAVVDGVELVCLDEICRSPACPPGTLDCPCSDGACAAGLECSDVSGEALCGVRVLCPVGTHGCECYPDETCDPIDDETGQRCDEGVCVLDVCARGERGCQCLSGERCLDGDDICDMGLCVRDTGQTVAPPADPRCYTPCRFDLQGGEGPDRICDEGLMAGCIGDALCAEGSCVTPEALAQAPAMLTACRFDASCPDFQSCIAGRCYSDCEETADCRGERVCHRKACRLPCTVAGAGCPRGEHCALFDGVSGHCMPLGLPRSDLYKQAAAAAAPVFEIDTASIDLTPLRDRASVVVENPGDVAQTITVRRAFHRLRGSDDKVEMAALDWLLLAAGGGPSTASDLELAVPARGAVTLIVSAAAPPAGSPASGGWSGALELSNAGGAKKTVALAYAVGVAGTWAGSIVTYAEFADRDLARDTGVDPKTDNALARRWLAVGEGTVSVAEFEAMLRAVRDESWREPLIRERCARAYPGLDPPLCYLYDGGSAGDTGIRAMTNRAETVKVPAGPVDLPWSMTIGADGAGRVDSDSALHIPGNPAVRLRFVGDPSTCPAAPAACINRLEPGQRLVRSRVGGRAWASRCPAGLDGQRMPWFVPLFGETVDGDDGGAARPVCLSRDLPFRDADLSAGLSRANPLPDGRALDVTVEVVDGALLEQRVLFALVRQTVSGVFGPVETRYGYLLLHRADGARPVEAIPAGDGAGRVEPIALGGCSDAVLSLALGRPAAGLDAVADAELAGLVEVLIDGRPSAAAPPAGDPGPPVHYLCVDRGRFDVACPEGSQVRYFRAEDAAGVAGHACNDRPTVCTRGETCALECDVGVLCAARGDCAATLDGWLADGAHGAVAVTDWVCADGQPSCDLPTTGADRRTGKVFDPPGDGARVMPRFAQQVADGFRYRAQFRNRSGLGIGFTPDACVDGANAIPYCYDAEVIEALRARVDCAGELRLTRADRLDAALRARLDGFLTAVHAYEETRVPDLPTPVVEDGFERAYAELLVMLGDDSMTRGFASRYDLAEQRLADFPGSRLEADGIDLSGQAGFELLSFYQSTQYFQLALDRFFAKAPLITAGIGSYAGAPMAVSWLPRVLGASTKKARAMAEIAERYVTFDRADLARAVIRRGFAAAWLESVVILQLFDRLADRADAQTRAQIRAALQDAQLAFSSALRDMRSSFESITDAPAVFGIPKNFVPFPALDPREVNSRAVNAFDVALARARDKVEIAIGSEVEALAQARQFDVDQAAFTDEMANLKRQYDNELSALCGSFESDGAIYPAVARYAALGPLERGIAEPCGLLGNGEIFSKLQEIAETAEQVESARRRVVGLRDDAESLQRQMDAQCGRIKRFEDYQFTLGSEIRSTRVAIDSLERTVDTLERVVNEASEIRDATSCIVGVATDCPTKMAGMAAYMVVATTSLVAQGTAEAQIVVANDEIEATMLRMQSREILEECDAISIDLRAEMERVVSQIPALISEMAQVELTHRRLKGELGGLRNDAASAQANREEAEQLRINTEIARNDPNIRIYRNAAMVVADAHFDAALREAYKATRVFEYYTSQSFAARDELLLIRLAGRGERNLRDYLLGLEEAFFEFEQVYANPDLRLHVVSVRDLKAERLAGQTAATIGQRNVSFRQKLRTDARGHVVLDFRTALGDTSPLTADHKVLYVEADLVGRNLGDGLGRLYLTLPEDNTGTVLGVEGDTAAYAFPARTAVLNPTFNGKRGADGVEFDRALFRNERLRDRPLINTKWEVRLDPKGESVNTDIDLDQLEDIVLYIYYTDFTTGL